MLQQHLTPTAAAPGVIAAGSSGGAANGSHHRSSHRAETVKQAVILAAGSGSRLGTDVPKCLSDLGGRPLIEHQLDALRSAGVESVVIVVGFRHELVRERVGDAARFVLNQRYADTNSLYSFLMARELVSGSAFVLNADVFFDVRILSRLQAVDGCALAYDSASGTDPEHMKVRALDGALVEMRKDLPREQCDGENVGVLRLHHAAVEDAFAAASGIIHFQGLQRAWVASAINRIAWHRRFTCVDVAGLPWVEIDYPEDLRRARSQVLPEIAASREIAAAGARSAAQCIAAV